MALLVVRGFVCVDVRVVAVVVVCGVVIVSVII